MLQRTLPLVALTGLVLAGCPADDAPPGDGSSSGDTTNGVTTNTTPPTTTTMMTVDSGSSSSSTDPTMGSSSTGPEAGPFEFNDADPDDYTQYDRAGFPAVSSGLVILGDKDAYNMGTPLNDADSVFIQDIRDSLFLLHFGIDENDNNTGLDDDLLGIPLQPCDGDVGGSCIMQGGPFVIPDVLRLNLEADPADPMTAFPNGRRPPEPVMDIILAVVLLELGPMQPITALLDFDGDGMPGPSVNPIENDVELPGSFPYLAAPHR